MKKKLLVMCTGNSFRSQLAEGYFRHFGGDKLEVYSAGVRASGIVAPSSIDLMKEEGIDISSHESTQADVYADTSFDFVIALGEPARDLSPEFPGSMRVFQDFPDPERTDDKSEEEYMNEKRAVRKMIKEWCKQFVSKNV